MTAPRTRLFLFAGNGSYHNRGCEAIVRGTTALLRQAFGPCKFTSAYFAPRACQDAAQETDPDIAHIPLYPVERWSKAWLARRGLQVVAPTRAQVSRFSVLRESICQADAVLMLGGDNYTLDYGSPDPFFHLNRYVRDQGKPVILWNVSVGPFSRDGSYERWAAAELRKATAIFARETITQTYLETIGVKDNVWLTADPAFWLTAEVPPLPAGLAALLDRGAIGLNLSPLFASRYWGDHWETWVHEAASLVKAVLAARGEPLLLIPHVMDSNRPNQQGDDYVFLRSVIERVSASPERLQLVGPAYNAGQLKWIIGRLRAFIGARMHATLAAISANVPAIFLAYSAKAQGMAQDIYGHTEWVLSGPTLAPRALAERTSQLLNDEASIRDHLRAVLPAMRQRSFAAATLLQTILGQRLVVDHLSE